MDGNTPAFPPNAGWESNNPQHRGISKREYFAAMAMQSIIASPECGLNNVYSMIAKSAYFMADAMIKESENAAR